MDAVTVFGFVLGLAGGGWLGYKRGPRKTVTVPVQYPSELLRTHRPEHEDIRIANSIADESIDKVKIYRDFLQAYLEKEGLAPAQVNEQLDRLETIAERSMKSR